MQKIQDPVVRLLWKPSFLFQTIHSVQLVSGLEKLKKLFRLSGLSFNDVTS